MPYCDLRLFGKRAAFHEPDSAVPEDPSMD